LEKLAGNIIEQSGEEKKKKECYGRADSRRYVLKKAGEREGCGISIAGKFLKRGREVIARGGVIKRSYN